MSYSNMRNCPKCGSVFTFVKSPICSKCQEEEQEIFESVRIYIKENENKTIKEVSEATGVSVKKILAYIKSGKIDLVIDGEKFRYPCKHCGKKIVVGNFCDKCAKKFKEGLQKKTQQKEEKKIVLNKRLNR